MAPRTPGGRRPVPRPARRLGGSTPFDPRGPGSFLRHHRPELLAALGRVDLRPQVFLQDSGSRLPLDDGSVELVVTSPPYPYVERWDELFEAALGLSPGSLADDPRHLPAVHESLARTWRECYRLLRPGGMLCVNVGDATRRVGGEFRLLPNHAHVLHACERAGFTPLVPLLWKKPTNKPNSFLGSGFSPTNAYVTLDCEHILLFRKGARRAFPAKDLLRTASQFSKAERDRWFSQVWELRGASQRDGRASFPREVPYRLVRMFSVLGDTVLDPFAGAGGTLAVAQREGRRAIGVEREPPLASALRARLEASSTSPEEVLARLEERYPGGTAGGEEGGAPAGGEGPAGDAGVPDR